MPASHEVDWSQLSPTALEIVKRVYLREGVGGYTRAEIAVILESERDKFEHLIPPRGPITQSWVSNMTALVRKEIRQQQDAAAD